MLDAQLQLKGAKADYINTRAKVQSDLMDQKAAGATVDGGLLAGAAAGADGQVVCTTWA